MFMHARNFMLRRRQKPLLAANGHCIFYHLITLLSILLGSRANFLRFAQFADFFSLSFETFDYKNALKRPKNL